MFDDATLKAVVTKALTADITIPNGHNGALVVMVDSGRVQLVTAAKINEHWQVEAVVTHDWHGGTDVQAVSKVTW